MKINFGVNDIPYVRAPSKRARKVTAGTVTTGDVAGFLENKYHVMRTFLEVHEADILDDLESGFQKAMDEILIRGMTGGLENFDFAAGAMSKIEDRFKLFITSGEVEHVSIPGVPTQAAIDRRRGKKRSARKKNKTVGDGTSFVDSGLFVANFRAWATR